MDETKEEPVTANLEQSSKDNFSWEEWTVIDDGDDSRNCTTSQLVQFDDATGSETSFSGIDNTSDAEEVHECIDVLLERDLEECPGAMIMDNHYNDESDGVSIITESDADEPVSNVNKGEIVHENYFCAMAKRYRDIELKNLRMIFLIVCCLLGMAILCIAIKIGTCRNSDAIDLTMKTKCNNLFALVKQSADVNDVAREIKPGTQKPVFEEKKLQNRTGNEAKQLPYAEEYLKTIDSSINDPDNPLFDRLQMFLHTICFLMEDIRSSDPLTRNSECETRLSDLMNLRILLKSVVNELDASERSTHERFLQNVEFQIKSMSDTFVSDFARALDKLAVKNHKKLDKIGVKLAERLCILRNTLPSDSKHRDSLEKNNTFIKNCDNIATREFDERRRNSISRSPVSLKRKKKNPKEREAARSSNSNKKCRGYALKRQNNTRPTETFFENQDNPWDARKCHNKSLPNTAMLLPPPKASCNLKRKSFSTVKHQKDVDGTKVTEKYRGKSQLKGDRGASKVLKTKMQFDKRKNRKPNTPSLNLDDDMYTIKRTKENMVGKARSRSILSGPQNMNADKKCERIYPPNPTGSRVKKRFGKEDNEFILVGRNEEKEPMQNNGHWQFDRSQIRDKLRKDKSRSNWYFDRMGNRKSSRMNCDDENQDPRCGASHQ